MSDSYCHACYPLKVRSHFGTYFGDLMDIVLTGFWGSKAKAQLPRFSWWFSVTHLWYKFMELCRIVRFSAEFDRKDHYPRSWACIEEAKARGIPIESIKILGRTSTYYRVRFGNKYYYFDAVPSRSLNFRLDEKHWAKRKMLKAGYPATEGRMFWSTKRALRYGKKFARLNLADGDGNFGGPLVVKPARGTHSYHVTAPIHTEDDLRQAIALATQYQPRFIVERYVTGELYRVTVINFHQVYLARREAPNVVGDGVHTVRELIEIKNADPRRGETGQKDTTLHKIPVSSSSSPSPNPSHQGRGIEMNPSPLVGEGQGGGQLTTTERALARAGLTLDHIPQKGEKIVLHSKTSIGSGGDIFEETPLLHPENREMFRRAARLFGTDLVGFDVIAQDLSQPYSEQVCGIIEANSIPMIDFHHYPAFGEPQRAASALWDGIIADTRVRYVYPVMLPQRSLVTRLLWHFLDVMVPLVRDFVLRFAMTHKFLRRQRFHLGWLRPNVVPETAIAHLKMQGFEVVRPEWIDYGETCGLRKLLDHERQCHIRFFEDGEVRAHVEYAPEARPIAHLLEQGLHAAHDVAHKWLDQFIERREERRSPPFPPGQSALRAGGQGGD